MELNTNSMPMKTSVMLLLPILFFLGCNDGEKPLGDGYHLASEGGYSTLFYTSEKKAARGLVIVEGNILRLNFNDSLIIVESKDDKTEVHQFWLIDKHIEIDLNPCKGKWSSSCDSLSKINRFNFRDSLELHQALRERNSRLSLSEGK